MADDELKDKDENADNENKIMPGIFTDIDWPRFGQWALILGVLVWVLQLFITTLHTTEEANRMERTEMREMYHQAMEERVEALERLIPVVRGNNPAPQSNP